MPVISGGSGGSGLPSGVTIQTGTAEPQGAVVPASLGGLYIDTTHGGLHQAVGVTSADWVAIGGEARFSEAGLSIFISGGLKVASVIGETSAQLTDIAAVNGSGNGLFWQLNGADESQSLEAVVGVGGGKTIVLAAATGTLGPADGGVKFPTADPHVVGAWWDNAGTLTRSAG